MQYTIIVPSKKPIILYKLFDFGIISSNTTNNIVPAANDKNTPINVLNIPLEEFDVVEKQVNIPIGAGLKASGEIEIAKDGTIGIKQISIDKVVQAPGEDLILDGGGASN